MGEGPGVGTPGVGLHPTFDIRVLDDILFIAWKLRRSVMFIVKRQTNRLKLRRSDMYLTFMKWKFKNTTTNMFLIGLNTGTVMN